MKSKWKIFLLGSFTVAAWILAGAGESKAPDQKLAHHLNGICKIAKSHVKVPDTGVKELFHYLGHHSASMMQEFGQTLVLIERISDDRAHDRRAKKAGQRIRKPLQRCERDLERFFIAVENDRAASARLERGSQRLGRTLELMFGEEAASKGLESLLLEVATHN